MIERKRTGYIVIGIIGVFVGLIGLMIGYNKYHEKCQKDCVCNCIEPVDFYKTFAGNYKYVNDDNSDYYMNGIEFKDDGTFYSKDCVGIGFSGSYYISKNSINGYFPLTLMDTNGVIGVLNYDGKDTLFSFKQEGEEKYLTIPGNISCIGMGIEEYKMVRE